MTVDRQDSVFVWGEAGGNAETSGFRLANGGD